MTVILWDPLKGEMLQAIDAHPRYITSCAFSVDGQYLASGSNDRTCRVWKLHLGPSAPPAEAADIKVDLLGCGGNKISPIKPLSDWSVQDVCDWLKSLGLEQYVVTFKSNEIDGQELNNITSEVLRSDLAISALGHRNKIIRGIESIKEQCILEQLQGQTTSDSDIPDELLCPITRELMRDPVIASDGYSYERSSIESWITSGKNTSPMTNSPLPNTVLMPNRMLKMLIQRQESK
ncbi:WD repeat, SAM and U-box domain-containing protein 1-like [Saccoglossus kowalevskii]|uniref:WD repeat, SAM and U-box domain-containing protein 1 n=1 Tax=Saccoglossus kowalevskii TaxID=10224 RepID=A0ABM0LZP3_SACKO|nr:PREDICTED: WD repeat, SAM and U-box domain-containing protein 1-like [Saccoglossus kowalevskii]